MEAKTLEKIAEAVHNGWMEAKRAKGVTTRTLDTTGEELLRPYAELSEEAKDLDRGTVRSVLEALARAGFVLTPGGVAEKPKPQICEPIGQPTKADLAGMGQAGTDTPSFYADHREPLLSAAPNYPGDPRD